MHAAPLPDTPPPDRPPPAPPPPPPALHKPTRTTAKDHAEVLDRFAEAAKSQARALKQEFEQQLKAQQLQQQRQQGGGPPGRPR